MGPRGERTIIDYHVERARKPARRRYRWPLLLLIAGGSFAMLGLAPQSEGTSPQTVIVPVELPEPAASARRQNGPPAEPPAENVTPVTPRESEQPAVESTVAGRPLTEVPVLSEVEETIAFTKMSATVGKGESLYFIFRKHGLDQRELMLLLKAKPYGPKLARLMPGQILEFTLDPSRSLKALEIRLDQTRTLRFTQAENAYSSDLVVTPLERRTAHAAGRIEESLFLAGRNAGLSNKIIMELVEIFGWDIDFALDIRSDDSFLVIYEELFKDGEKVSDGNILAAEFTNQKETFRAVRYVDPDGRAAYFSPDGLSMRKAFLRTPVKFGRVSSRFNLRRRHPILHRIRAHRGVDYAAAPGTPVRAAGDGKVIYLGRKGGYGRTVILRHGSTYTTLYAHLRSYAKGMRSGKRVQQGQVIGYVGSSGLATGPHLHYEFRVRGRHRNPLTVKLPKAAPVPEKLRSDFLLKTKELVAQLDVLSKTRLALSE